MPRLCQAYAKHSVAQISPGRCEVSDGPVLYGMSGVGFEKKMGWSSEETGYSLVLLLFDGVNHESTNYIITEY